MSTLHFSMNNDVVFQDRTPLNTHTPYLSMNCNTLRLLGNVIRQHCYFMLLPQFLLNIKFCKAYCAIFYTIENIRPQLYNFGSCKPFWVMEDKLFVKAFLSLKN